MTEHEICIGCRWNGYPECLGTKMFIGEFMNIEKLKLGFQCGQKDSEITMDFSVKVKSEMELKIEILEERIKNLEEK